MKKSGLSKTLPAVAGAVIVIGGIAAAWNFSKDREHRELAERISEFGPRKGVPRTIDDLKRAIAAYEDAQELHVKDAAQTAVYWKILATRFQDRQMYLEAVKALEHAIRYTPDDEVLHYLTGLNAAQAAASLYGGAQGSPGEDTRRYLALAETAYLRAVELEPSYTQARYALGVMYAFDLERPEAAIEQLLRYMENRSGDSDAMFVLARAYYMTGNYAEALNWYDRAIPLTKDAAKRKEAEANRNRLRDLL